MVEISYADVLESLKDFIARPTLENQSEEPEIIRAYRVPYDFGIRIKTGMAYGRAGDYVVDIDGFIKIVRQREFEKLWSKLPEYISDFETPY